MLFVVLHLQDEMEASDINLVNIRHSAGIPEVARRLTMLVVEEGLTANRKRTLTDKEHRSLMRISISPWSDIGS